MHVYHLCLQFFPGRLWFLLRHNRIKGSVTADQSPAREHSLDRERKSGQSITVRRSPSPSLSLHCTPGGTRLIQVPFSLALTCCDPLWKDGPLWEVWDQWNTCWTRGPHCNNAHAPPSAGHVQGKENQGGKSRLTPSKARARLERIKVSH